MKAHHFQYFHLSVLLIRKTQTSIPGHLLFYLASYRDVIYFEDREVYLGLSVAWHDEFMISCDNSGNMCWIHNPFIG